MNNRRGGPPRYLYPDHTIEGNYYRDPNVFVAAWGGGPPRPDEQARLIGMTGYRQNPNPYQSPNERRGFTYQGIPRSWGPIFRGR
jgi:hypothetical protein